MRRANFKQRVDLPFGGELGELISSFNEMAERLAKYDEQNIEELTAQKAKLETLMFTIADGASFTRHRHGSYSGEPDLTAFIRLGRQGGCWEKYSASPARARPN